MSDNVNIIVQDTINEIVINSAVTVETIDINVQAAVDEVTIIANPNDYIININRIIGEQVQSDWNETDINAPDFIKNKPIIPAAQVNSDWNATSGVAEILNKPFIPTNTSDLINDGEDGINPFITLADVPPGGLTSVGLSMPVAFNVANSPLTSNGTLAVSAAGTSSQYIRGDGQLATLPTGAGGGSTVAYYLNGSINASVAGYKQLSNTATIGGGTDFTLTGNGLIAQFLTDLGNPNRLEIPGGAWNFEMYFQANSAGGNQKFYVELLKYNGTTFTSITSSISVPEEITGGTAIDLYLTSLAVPTTPLLVTDRLAIRVYIVDNAVGRTITLHTEDNTLCEIITTFSGGVTSLNGLTANTQYLAVGTTGTDFNISSLTDTHTFNLPTASALNRGALSTTDWTTFNGKFTLPSLTSGSVLFSNGTTIAQDNSNFFWDDTNNRLGIGTNAPTLALDVLCPQYSGIRVKAQSATYLKLESSATTSLTFDTSTNGSTMTLYNYGAFGINNNGGGNRRVTLFANGNLAINTIVDQGGIVQIKAPGALSTDIALRVRNSADTADLMTVNGVGGLNVGSTLAVGSNNFYSSGENRTRFYSTAEITDSLQIYTNGGAYNSSYGEIGFLFKNTSTQMASINFDTRAGVAAPFRFFVNPAGASAIDAMDIFRTGEVGIGTSNTNRGGKLQIKAPGALSTDIAFKVINSADNNDLFRIQGDGSFGKIIPGADGTFSFSGQAGAASAAIFQNGISNFNGFRVQKNAQTLIDEAGVNAFVATSAILELKATTKGFLPPRMTTTQKNAIATPASGLVVYDTTLGKLCVRGASAWETITSV